MQNRLVISLCDTSYIAYMRVCVIACSESRTTWKAEGHMHMCSLMPGRSSRDAELLTVVFIQEFKIQECVPWLDLIWLDVTWWECSWFSRCFVQGDSTCTRQAEGAPGSLDTLDLAAPNSADGTYGDIPSSLAPETLALSPLGSTNDDDPSRLAPDSFVLAPEDPSHSAGDTEV